MSIVIVGGSGILEGDEIEVMDRNGEVVGSGSFGAGRCGFALWVGDYDWLPEVRVTRRSQVIEAKLEALLDPGGFAADGFAVCIIDLATSQVTLASNPVGWSVQPNPFNDRMVVRRLNGGAGGGVITVYDASGRLVFRQAATGGREADVVVNATDWSAGNYLVKVQDENATQFLISTHLK
jgi:hypothetical protein